MLFIKENTSLNSHRNDLIEIWHFVNAYFNQLIFLSQISNRIKHMNYFDDDLRRKEPLCSQFTVRIVSLHTLTTSLLSMLIEIISILGLNPNIIWTSIFLTLTQFNHRSLNNYNVDDYNTLQWNIKCSMQNSLLKIYSVELNYFSSLHKFIIVL